MSVPRVGGRVQRRSTGDIGQVARGEYLGGRRAEWVVFGSGPALRVEVVDHDDLKTLPGNTGAQEPVPPYRCTWLDCTYTGWIPCPFHGRFPGE